MISVIRSGLSGITQEISVISNNIGNSGRGLVKILIQHKIKMHGISHKPQAL